MNSFYHNTIDPNSTNLVRLVMIQPNFNRCKGCNGVTTELKTHLEVYKSKYKIASDFYNLSIRS